MTTELQTTQETALAIPSDVSIGAMEMAIGGGDFSRFTSGDKLRFLTATCNSLRLNPLTLPIRIIKMDGREVMYATSECSAQLAYRDKVSVKKVEEKLEHECYLVRVIASTPDGRSFEEVGVVEMTYPEKVWEWNNGQKTSRPHPKAGKLFEGKEWANAIMKCHTKATRRAILRICSLGIPDETELDDMPRAQVSAVSSIVEEESATARAEKLNQALTAGEKADVIDIHESRGVTSPPADTAATGSQISQEPSESKPTVQPPIAATATPVPEVVPPAPDDDFGAAPEPTKLSEDEVFIRNFETVLSENLDSIPYIIAKRRLVKGAGLETIDKDYAKKIIDNPKGFYRAVEAWVKGGRK